MFVNDKTSGLANEFLRNQKKTIWKVEPPFIVAVN